MFDKKYTYRPCGNHQPTVDDFFLKDYIFSFDCRHNHQYIVHVEEYPQHFFVIKFHLKNHTNSPNKYQKLSQLFDAPRVISTCLDILINEFYRCRTNASFGFIGANSENESKVNTKRFRVYRKVMENKFSPVTFRHYCDSSKSAYLMLNRIALKANQDLLHNIEQLFLQMTA